MRTRPTTTLNFPSHLPAGAPLPIQQEQGPRARLSPKPENASGRPNPQRVRARKAGPEVTIGAV